MGEQVIAKKLEVPHTFHFWVDKDTGILIKYDVKGELTSYLHPDKLNINIGMRK